MRAPIKPLLKNVQFWLLIIFVFYALPSLSCAIWLHQNTDVPIWPAVAEGFLRGAAIFATLFAMLLYGLTGALCAPFLREAWPYSIVASLFFVALVIICAKKVSVFWRSKLLAVIVLAWFAYGLYCSTSFEIL